MISFFTFVYFTFEVDNTPYFNFEKFVHILKQIFEAHPVIKLKFTILDCTIIFEKYPTIKYHQEVINNNPNEVISCS